MILSLYNGGAHLDFRSRDTLTPMHKAAIMGNERALHCLLELGAFAEVRDSRSLTPLFYAVVHASSVACLEHLLFNGSPVGCRDENNWQEVHHACKTGLAQHLDHLLYYGAGMNAKNNSGNTPLHVCAIHSQESCARILLFRGCVKSERNRANQTAFDTAVIASNQLIAELIRNHTDSQVVPIKDRPFYNTKRRSVYVTSSGSSSSENKSSAAAALTSNTMINWSQANNDDADSSGGGSSSSCSDSAAVRSRSIPKIDQFTASNVYAMTGQAPDSSMTIAKAAAAAAAAAAVNPALTSLLHSQNQNQSGSSSPTSRSRSISSDDHGFGLVSLPNHGGGGEGAGGSTNIVGYAYPRRRLYPSIPNRMFICVKPHRPAQSGEIELKRGEIIELLSVGDSGYWEGRCVSGGNEGWFKACCVEEFCMPKDTCGGSSGVPCTDSIVVKRQTLIDLLTHNDVNAPRTVVLQKGKKGFGFVLRGAKSKLKFFIRKK